MSSFGSGSSSYSGSRNSFKSGSVCRADREQFEERMWEQFQEQVWRAAQRGSGSKNSKDEVGDCDCNKNYGVSELRYRYQCSENSAEIKIFHGKELRDVVCRFEAINPRRE